MRAVVSVAVRRAPRGLTLVELLVVLLLLGLLATLAVSRVRVARQRAYMGAIQSDLRNLVTAQEAYYQDQSRAYARRVEDLGQRFRSSPGVIVRITNVTPRGWTATAEHSASRVSCTVGVEGDTPIPATCTTSGTSGSPDK